MPKLPKTDRARSSELSGGEGFTYEDAAVAYYLTALLRSEGAAGAPGRVFAVSVQQAAQGEPLDDLIVDLEAADGARRLSLQVKRPLTISASASNEDFRELMANAVGTRAKKDFRVGKDRFGFLARTVGDDRLNALSRIIAWAQASPTGAEFEARFSGSQAGKGDIALRAELAPLIDAPDVEAERDFYAHFVALRMDGLEPGGDRYAEMANRLGDVAADGSEQGRAFADLLCRCARLGAGSAKIWTRATLIAELRPAIRLKPTPSYARDIAALTDLAASYASDIREDIGGAVIVRDVLVASAEASTARYRVSNLSGLPGCGKSVILRRVVKRAIAHGPVLFLKSDRLSGASWREFAQANGLDHLSPAELLVEIGAGGTATLFIDSVDRIKPAQRGIVTDLLSAIENEPALAHWTVLVSSRDQGLEAFRQWLPARFYRSTGIADVAVGLLNDEEAEALALERPHLRRLLFGADAVQEIARRPFFAAVLADQFAGADPDEAPPQTENELIAAWWRAGGYNAPQEKVIERQRALIDLAETGSGSLGKMIQARDLRDATLSQAFPLKTDRIIDIVEEGSVFSFAHDIFFEWAFFRLLIDRGDAWREAIISAGEAPLLARVVGLLSQHWFEGDFAWAQEYFRIDAASLRPQWRRAWLLGPPASGRFIPKLATFEAPLYADDAVLLETFLVWFQAERTIPNPLILRSTNVPLEGAALVRAADALGWPSDFALWQRVLTWILAREKYFPASAIVHAVELFAVLQNMVGDLPNPLSARIVETAETWLLELDKNPTIRDEIPDRWSAINDEARAALVRSLRRLILRSGRAYPDKARAIVERAIALERRPSGLFDAIVAFSPILAHVCPETLADLVRAEVYELSPKERLDAERADREKYYEKLGTLRAKPEAERTEQEQRFLDAPPWFGSMGSDSFDFDDLGIDRYHSSFFPATPLHQPFASLFELAPDVARKLVRCMSNRATAAWRQLPAIEPEKFATPLPIELNFPWGAQRFWGDEHIYTWYLGAWAPQPLEAAFLALTYWAHKRLEAGDDPDEIIRLVLEGQESVAALGLAVSLAIETESVSEATLPLVGCQRLWHVDLSRQVSDPGRPSAVMGMDPRKDMSADQLAAFEFLLGRRARKHSIRDLVALFIVGRDKGLSEKLAADLRNFPHELPFSYEEEKQGEERRAELLETAKIWATWGDRDNYEVARADEPDRVAVIFEAPDEVRSENLEARRKESAEAIADFNVVGWADRSLRQEALDPRFSLSSVLAHARARDREALMSAVEEPGEGFEQSAVAAAAAAAMTFADDPADIAWGRSVLARVLPMENKSGPFEDSKNSVDPRLYMVTALFHCLKRGRAESGDAEALLRLAASANGHVREYALTALLWSKQDPRLTFIAGALASDLFCTHASNLNDVGSRDRSADRSHTAEALTRAIDRLRTDAPFAFTLPPAAWEFSAPPRRSWEKTEPKKVWRHPSFFFEQHSAAAVLQKFPVEAWLSEPSSKEAVLDYADALMRWTKERLYPAWRVEERERHGADLFQWLHAFGDFVARLLPFMAAEEFVDKLVRPIADHKDEDGLRYVSAVATALVCRAVYDAKTVSDEVMAVLYFCLSRMLAERVFVRESYRAGEIRGSDLASMIRALMFVSIKDAFGAMRFANNEWRDLPRVLPIVDRLMAGAGWATFVMDCYLTLCERAGGAMPVDAFMRHVTANIGAQKDHPQDWRENALLARIAGVVQGLAEAHYPLQREQAHNLLSVLDSLVDLGDRRAAALQQSEYFRGVQVESKAA